VNKKNTKCARKRAKNGKKNQFFVIFLTSFTQIFFITIYTGCLVYPSRRTCRRVIVPTTGKGRVRRRR